MGVHERRQREKESVRANILQAAFNLVKTDGWASLSMRKIADAIEYSAPVVYDHFENKEAILLKYLSRDFSFCKKICLKRRKNTKHLKSNLQL